MKDRTKTIVLVLSGMCFAFLSLTGLILDITDGDLTVVSVFKQHFNAYIICYALLCVSFFVILKTVYCKVDCFLESSVIADDYVEKIVVPLKRWLLISLILLLFWLPYIIILFPGTFGGLDYFWQLMQGYGALPFSNHHPVFSTLIFSSLYRIGYLIGGAAGGIFFTCFVQMLIMVLVISFCIAMLNEMGVPKMVCICIFALISLCPVFPTHAIWAIKDSLFSSFTVLLFFCSFLFIIGKSKSISIPGIASLPALIILSVLVSIIRNGVLPIVVVQMAMIAIYCVHFERKEHKGYNSSIKALASICVIVIATTCWNSFLDYKCVYPTNFRESVGVPGRQIMECYRQRPNKFSESDIKLLKKIYRDDISNGYTLNDIAARNDYINADYIKPSRFNSNEEIKKYLELWIRTGVHNPEIYFDQGLRGTYAYWWIGYDANDVVHPIPIPTIQGFFGDVNVKQNPIKYYFKPLVWTLSEDKTALEQTFYEYLKSYPEVRELIDLNNSNPVAVEKLDTIIEKIKDVPFLSIVITPGFYLWISLICMVYLFSRRKEGVLIWPILLIAAIACLSPINGYMRYVLPLDIMAVLLVGICFVPLSQKN